jgi:hypothetical protein
VLKRIALEDPEPYVRYPAMMRLEDQVGLRRVALADPDLSVRSAAVWRITDQAILWELAHLDLSWVKCPSALGGGF